MQKKAILLGICLLVSSSLACSLVTRAVEQVTGRRDRPVPTAQERTETAPSRPDDTPAPDYQPEEEPRGAVPNATIRPELDLDRLDSYRMTYTLEITGQDSSGESKAGSLEVVKEVNRTDGRAHFRYTTTGDAIPLGLSGDPDFEVFHLEDTTYLVNLDPEIGLSCSSISGSGLPDFTNGTYSISELLGEINDAQRETDNMQINGRLADRYRLDIENLSGGADRFETAAGEFWLDRELGVVLSMTGRASGKDLLYGQLAEGRFSWNYTVDAVNEPVQINLPPDCAGQVPAQDIPLPENAIDPASFSGTLTYTSPDPPAEVAEFYQTRLPALGWESSGDNQLGTMLSLTFRKAGRQLEIYITQEGDGSSVILMETD